MAFWRRTRADADEGKAAPRGATMVPLSEVLAQLTGPTAQAGPADPLPRPEEWFQVPFNPGRPFTPSPVNAPRTDTGRPEPRLFEYPVSWNLKTTSERLVPWTTLRTAADMPIVRQCIGHRQRELTALGWDVTVSQGAIEEAQKAGASKAEATDALLDKLAPEIKRLVAFWQTPDPEQGLEFGDWLWQLVEEQLVLDAVAIYPRLTYGGDLLALRTIDGSTIKPLLDETGGRPQPPFPAYQQVLYGFPRGEFTADLDGDGQATGMSADHLIYRRRGIRTFTPYGFSPVEQALVDIDLYLKRHQWMRAEYTEGVTPEMVLKNLGTSGWTARETLDYERDYNDQLSGSTAERMRARILPPGLEPAQMTQVPDRYRPDYDLHLIKLVASHLGVPITELGFTESKGLGSTGLHEGQASVNYRTGTLPDARWWQKLFTRVMRIHLGAPAELEFKFLGLDEEDEADADAIAEARVRSGRMTVNEDRDRLGLPRFDLPEADIPLVVTNRGVIPLEGALAAAEAAAQVTQNLPKPGQPEQPESGDEGEQSDEGDQGAQGEQVAKTQLAAFRRWARKRQAPGRRFEFTADQTLLLKMAPDLADDGRVTFKAGDAGPKDRWPGWAHDQALAAHYARLIRKALAGVDTADVAGRWLQARKTADPADSTAGGEQAARQWLEALGLARQLTVALRVPLTDLWTEAYLVGDRSARAIHTSSAPDWGSWKPGNPQAARLLLGGQRALQDLLDHYGVTTLRSITGTRLGELATQLATSLRDGWSVDHLARELRHILDDASTADMVATTETARAQSQASMAYYQQAGIDGVEWWTAPTDACPICLGNAAQGPIRRGQTFSSGEDAPPAHPRCRCTVAPASLVPIRE